MEPLELYKLLEKFKEFVEEDSELDPEQEIELLLRVNDLQISLEKIAKNRVIPCTKINLDELSAPELKAIYQDKHQCPNLRECAKEILMKRFHQDDH